MSRANDKVLREASREAGKAWRERVAREEAIEAAERAVLEAAEAETDAERAQPDEADDWYRLARLLVDAKCKRRDAVDELRRLRHPETEGNE